MSAEKLVRGRKEQYTFTVDSECGETHSGCACMIRVRATLEAELERVKAELERTRTEVWALRAMCVSGLPRKEAVK